jgi:hypothetical protein
VSEETVQVSDNSKAIIIHPRPARGLLIELVQRNLVYSCSSAVLFVSGVSWPSKKAS